MATGILIRRAVDTDLDAVLEIHNTAIRESLAIWTEQEADRADRERWLAAHDAAGHPVLVAIADGVLAGYAAYGPWRERMGYRYTVENSVYVAEAFQRRGIGRLLMVDLIALAREAGLHVIVAGIEAGNEPSIQLHRSLDFEEPVIVRGVGTKFGSWLDLAFMRLDLTGGA